MEAFLQCEHVFNLLSTLMLFQPASSEEQKKMLKAMSSGDLVKVDSLRKNSQDGRCVPQLGTEGFTIMFFFFMAWL